MGGSMWLLHRLGWLALAIGAMVLSLWLFAAHSPARVHFTNTHYYPQGTI
jgi:hypothetical protein